VFERIPTPAPLVGDVVVHRVPLTVDAAERADLTAVLSVGEREHAAHFQRRRDRERFVVVRGALRVILAGYGAGFADRLVIVAGDHGKPMLVPPSPLRFNVSHSGAVGLVAIAFEREVGVDVEEIRPRPGLRAVADRFFAPGEIAALERLGPAEFVAGFYRCWTRKEAYVKARGLGLRLALSDFEVSVGAADPSRSLLVGGPAVDPSWHLTDLEVPPGYVAALAAGASPG
jgi:4'-phosphopantetheinyl transferase